MFIFTIGFVNIWALFQNKAQDIIDELVPDPEHILWTSTLTSAEYISNVPKDYTIQIWTDSAVSLNLFTYLFFYICISWKSTENAISFGSAGKIKCHVYIISYKSSL